MSDKPRPVSRVVGDPDAVRALYATTFVSSWLGQARPVERICADPDRRAAGWAQWALSNLTDIDTSERRYPAIWLDGLFYDPHGHAPKLRPHLEIPKHARNRPWPEFPRRLAQAGNGLSFDWWVYPEVTALRRSLFNVPAGDITPVYDLLDGHVAQLVAAVRTFNQQIAPQFSEVAMLLQTADDGLSATATGDFTPDEVATFFPAAEQLGLRVEYDSRLRDRSGTRAARRVGIWQIVADVDGKRAAAGVVTPRLTQRSMLTDQLFDVTSEATAAALVRALLLRRLLARHLDAGTTLSVQVTDGPPPTPRPAPTPPSGPTPHLQARVAKAGQALPDASVEAAVHFVTVYDDAAEAWRALREWAGQDKALTVAESGFRAAHANASRAIRRAEDPDRADIDVLLPLAWADGKILRVTFSLPQS